MTWHLPFKPGHGYFYQESRHLTLSLYRSLLRTARRFEQPHQQWFLKQTIRERFRFHQCETSRKRSLALLTQGDQALQQLNLALEGHGAVQKYINDLAIGKTGPMAHVIQKLRKIPDILQRTITATDIRSQAAKHRHPDRIPLPNHLSRAARIPPVPTDPRQVAAAVTLLKLKKQYRRRREIRWKSYQVKIVTRASSGFRFVRRRGIRQPVTVAMMMKKRTKVNQKRVDRYFALTRQIEMMKSEGVFLTQLGLEAHTNEYVRPILHAIKLSSQFVRPPPSVD